MLKKTLYGTDARAKVLDGVRKISKAVKATLGPSGRNVLISQSAVIDYGVHNLPIEVSKDGYRVTQRFDLDDPFEKAGVLLVKEAAQKSVDQSGDGTTTTVLLLEAIVERGVKLIDGGANPMELKRGIDKAVEYVVGRLAEMATPIKGNVERIRQIATVSANNDSEIGNWIANAFEKIGDEGVIDLEPSKSVNTEIKIADGYKWSNGWISPYFINNKEKQITEFIDPLILLYDKRITHHTQIQKALEIAMGKGSPILIVCEDADDQGLAFLAMNSLQGRVRCCVVKAPAFGEDRRTEMEDLSVLTSGVFFSDTRGLDIKKVDEKQLGKAKKVIVTKDETIIIGGSANKAALENQLNELRMNLAQAKNEDEKSPIEKRIARLTGGVAVIHVGAATETEMKERLDRFDDSVRAVKAAISEGFLAGGATGFIRCIHPSPSSDSVKLINEVLLEPLSQICKNAGVNDVVIVEKVLASENSVGYNAKTDAIEDLIDSGIIDPKKVLRCALQNAASAASMILTSEVLICDTM